MPSPDPSTLAGVQELIRTMYHRKDGQRGLAGTYMWFIEEVGELATALRSEGDDETAAEFADVLAWLVTLANIRGIDLTAAFLEKYGRGCPGCGEMVCICGTEEKP